MTENTGRDLLKKEDHTAGLTKSAVTTAASTFPPKKAKEKTEKRILVAITSRTTIELPAHLSPEEIEQRVAKYIQLHGSKI